MQYVPQLDNHSKTVATEVTENLKELYQHYYSG